MNPPLLSALSPLHDEARSCFTDQLVSVVHWLGRRHELMYLESWGFSLDSASAKATTLGDRVHPGTGDTLANLERYHGIRLYRLNPQSLPEWKGILQQQWSREMPVIISMDTYTCPWDVGYQRFHSSHTCLAVGWDEGEDAIICCDAFYQKERIAYPVSGMEREIGPCWIFEVVGEERKDVNAQKITRLAVSHFRQLSSLEAILTFSQEITEPEAFKKELQILESGHTYGSPLMLSLLDVARFRKLMAQLFRYLNQLDYSRHLEAFQSEFEEAARRWAVIRAMFIKAQHLRQPEKQAEKLADRIREAASQEQRLSSDMLEWSCQATERDNR
ncbi:hypothetical protein ACQKK5_12480 [Brevibacillus panacihumi]|uniref:hypothetical protein n=1 Tax=Brevibacillus panacihumi TaxID=497735 RepID=UPI003D03CEA8